MKIKLTSIQEEVLSYIIDNGYITMQDMWRFYSTKKSSRNTMNRLISLGFIKEVPEVFGKFRYTGKKYKR